MSHYDPRLDARDDIASELRARKGAIEKFKSNSTRELILKGEEIMERNVQYYDRFKKPRGRTLSGQNLTQFVLEQAIRMHVSNQTSSNIIDNYVMTENALRRVLFIDESISQIYHNFDNLPRPFCKHLPDLPILCSSLGEIDYLVSSVFDVCYWIFFDRSEVNCGKYIPFEDYEYFLKELEKKIDDESSTFSIREENEYRLMELLETRRWSLCTACHTNFNSECSYFNAIRTTMKHLMNIKECLYEWRQDPTPSFELDTNKDAPIVSALKKVLVARPDKVKPYTSWLKEETYKEYNKKGWIVETYR